MDTAAPISDSGLPESSCLHTFGSSCGAKNPLVEFEIINFQRKMLQNSDAILLLESTVLRREG